MKLNDSKATKRAKNVMDLILFNNLDITLPFDTLANANKFNQAINSVRHRDREHNRKINIEWNNVTMYDQVIQNKVEKDGIWHVELMHVSKIFDKMTIIDQATNNQITNNLDGEPREPVELNTPQDETRAELNTQLADVRQGLNTPGVKESDMQALMSAESAILDELAQLDRPQNIPNSEDTPEPLQSLIPSQDDDEIVGGLEIPTGQKLF